MDSAKFADFVVTETTYKTVSSHSISAYVFVPKASPSPDASNGKRPVIVRLHGGFLVTGSAIFDEWIPQWFISYALLHNAIIVSPNYRLLPEASGLEILSDITDFQTWLTSTFPSYLAANSSTASAKVEADLDRILVCGESAGGYLAVMAALTQGISTPSPVRAVIAAYPMLDLDDAWYTKASEKVLFGAPQVPLAVLSAHLDSIKAGKTPSVVSDSKPPARIELALSMIQQGSFTSILGSDDSLFPFRVLEKIDIGRETEKVPKMFLYHGKQDSAVPYEGTVKFVEAAKAKLGNDAVDVYFGPGEHGFDEGASLETPWLEEGLAKVTAAWLQ